MTFGSALWGGIALGLFMAISVGPTLFAIIRYSMNHSYKAGLFFVLGVSLSDILYVTLANFAAPWLQVLHRYDKVLSYSAAVLLMAVGIYSFSKKYVPRRPKSTGIMPVSRSDTFKIFLTGFLMNSLNPALIFQWVAAATGLAAETVADRLVFFTACLSTVLSIDLLKVLLADKIKKRLTPRTIMYLQKTSAVFLFLIGLAILLVTLFHVSIKNPVAH